MKKILYLIAACCLVQACSMSKDDEGTDYVGSGGSLARFTIAGDHLYVVNETSLQTYSLASNALEPVKTDDKNLGFGVETIFPYDHYLLIGTETGMFICDISLPDYPSQLSSFQHLRSCDPVVAENGYAFITLNSANERCWTSQNELQIVDIHDATNPNIVKAFSLTSPKGLDIHNDTLFVCDNGLKILDVTQKTAPVSLAYFQDVSPDDVIYTQGRLLLIGSDGFSQYSIQPGQINKLSTIAVEP